MKKNIFGILAVVIALSASAFTTSSKPKVHRDTDLKWFSISSSVNLAPTASVPSADATYMEDQDGPTPPDGGCISGTDFQCVSGFNSSQVNLTTNTLNGTQTPVDHSEERQ